MAEHGEDRFPRPGDPSYEWVPLWARPDESHVLTLEAVTSPAIRGLFSEAQKIFGCTNPEITPEAILTAVLETIKFHQTTQKKGIVSTETLAWKVFGLSGNEDPNFGWVEEYLEGLCTIGQGIMPAGSDRYQTIPAPQVPEIQERDDSPRSRLPQTEEDVMRMIKRAGKKVEKQRR